MRFISPLLKRVIYPGLARSGYLRRRNATGPVALTYHGILPPTYRSLDYGLDANLVSLGAFREQLRFLKANYNLISPPEFQAWSEGGSGLPDRAVLLTCDDGLRSCLEYMLPVLLDERLSCIFFITGASLQSDSAMLWHELLYLAFVRARRPCQVHIANPPFEVSLEKQSQIGRACWHTLLYLSRISKTEREHALQLIWAQLKFSERIIADTGNRLRFQVMNRNDLLTLTSTGMDVGSHTSSHLALSAMGEQSALTEIRENRAALRQLTGQSIWSLAYPFGTEEAAGPREYQLAREAGFSCAFINSAGNFDSRFAIPRVHITHDMHISEFEAHLSGFHHSLQRLASRQIGAA